MDDLHETFFNAVNNNIVAQLEYILTQKALDVNKVDENGKSALHLAAMNEYYEICLMITKHKNTEITPDAKRETVLHILARRKMIEIDKKIVKQLVQAVIKRGGDVNQENKSGNTPLHDAIGHDNHVMTKILLSSGAKPIVVNHNGETALHCCFVNFNETIADIIVNKYSSTIDKIKKHKELANDKDTPLVSLLRWVIQVSTSVGDQEKAMNSKDRVIFEAIFTNAIKKGREDIVAVLLRESININTTDFNGWTPLHYAAMHGQFKIVKYILQHNSVLILVDRDGNTPLYYLVQKIPQHREICLYWQILSLFVQRGIDINFQNEKGETPLHEAAFRNNLPATQYFLSSGADMSLQTTSGENALHYGARCTSLDVLRLLLKHASHDLLDVESVDGTPEAVAQKCFNHEAKLEFKHMRNQTPLLRMPRSLWLHLFTFLSPDTLARISQVCTSFLNLSRDDALWRTIVTEHGDSILLNAIHRMHCFDSLTGSEFVKSVLVRDNNIRGYYHDRSLLLKCTAYVEPDDLPSPTLSKYDTLRKSMSAIFNKIRKKTAPAESSPPKHPNSEETPPQSPRIRPLNAVPLRVLTLGSPSHVKSALTRRLSQQETLFASVVSDWSIVILPVGETSQEIKIADVDDEKFNNLAKECDGVVVHCDFTHEDCLDTLTHHLREVKQKCGKDVRVIVFGAGEDRARAAPFEEIIYQCRAAYQDGVSIQAYLENTLLNAELALHMLMMSIRRYQKQTTKM